MSHAKLHDYQPGTYDGNFYTDPYGNEAFAEPAEYRMHQYIEPGFSLKLNQKGTYKMVDHMETRYGKGEGSIEEDVLIFDAIDATNN